MEGVGARRFSAWTWASGLALVAAACCYVLLDLTSLGQSYEDGAYLGAELSPLHFRHESDHMAHLVTICSFAALVLVIAALGLFCQRRALGLRAGAAACVATMLVEIGKRWLLPRPPLSNPLKAAPGVATFPSGHAAIATAGGMALILVVPPARRWQATVAASCYAVAVGTLVQIAPWHRPSDVIGADLIAFAVMSLAARMLLRTEVLAFEERRVAHRRLMGLFASAGLVAVAVGFWGLSRSLLWLAKPTQHTLASPSVAAVAHWGGVALTAGVGLILVLLFSLIMDVTSRHDMRLPPAPVAVPAGS